MEVRSGNCEELRILVGGIQTLRMFIEAAVEGQLVVGCARMSCVAGVPRP
jgi:hypothetical protein